MLVGYRKTMDGLRIPINPEFYKTIMTTPDNGILYVGSSKRSEFHSIVYVSSVTEKSFPIVKFFETKNK